MDSGKEQENSAEKGKLVNILDGTIN